MARRSQTSDTEDLRQRLSKLFADLPERLRTGTVVEQVGELVRAHHLLRDLGSSIGAALAPDDAGSGRARVLSYLQLQVGRVVHTDELMIVAGIGDYPRRVRELRTDHGWPILSGFSVMDFRANSLSAGIAVAQLPTPMVPEEYLLIEKRQDAQAVQRWQLASEIRTSDLTVKQKIEKYFRSNVGQRITIEELRYVSNNKTEWASQVRELAQNYKIKSKFQGDPSMPAGIFVLMSDK